MVGRMDYTDPDEYNYFLALEPGLVLRPTRVEPLSGWKAHHILKVLPKKKQRVPDFFEGYC